MPKVTVIIPIYNVEKWLRKCLNSAVAQTLKDIEVLAINDGSPDLSQEIVDEYVLETMYNMATERNSDIVICDIEEVYEDGTSVVTT